MGKTPRTDEHLRWRRENGYVAIITQDFARQLETELAEKEKQLAEAQELIKKLRRCANCKHKIEYALFGEVATACTLDVNEEENQTCKNFDKWESD